MKVNSDLIHKTYIKHIKYIVPLILNNKINLIYNYLLIKFIYSKDKATMKANLGRKERRKCFI